MLCDSQRIEMTVMRESKESLRRCLFQRHIFTSQALHNFWNGTWNAKIRRISHLMAENCWQFAKLLMCAYPALWGCPCCFRGNSWRARPCRWPFLRTRLLPPKWGDLPEPSPHCADGDVFDYQLHTHSICKEKNKKRENTYLKWRSQQLNSKVNHWTFLECLQLWAALAMHITALSRISATSVMSTNSISRASPPLSWIICKVSLSPRQLATTRRVSTWRSLKSCGKIKKTKCRWCGEYGPCTSCDRN